MKITDEMLAQEAYKDPELDPRDHGRNCPGNGEGDNPCCCDECDFFIACTGWKPGAIWDEDTQRYI